jgi:hypothetical protein
MNGLSVTEIRKPVESHVSLRTILERLSALLGQENSLLESGVSGEHAGFISAKNQILKELMVIHRSVDLSSLPQELVDILNSTRGLVDRNHALLNVQVAALHEVTDFLTRTAISQQGDGTYSRQPQ